MKLRHAAALTLLALIAATPSGYAQQDLLLEAKIPLGDVRGRIDHLAVDLARQRLFVAELGNDSLGVIDLKAGKVIKRIAGLSEAQGVAYYAATDTVFVASGGDSTVSLFSGDDLHAGPKIALGGDPDNVRIDTAAGRIYVGYGRGALAIIDAATLRQTGDIPLQGHPESFQLHPSQQRIYANVPSARQIAVIDQAAGRQIAAWRLPNATGNFPMAVDEAAGTVLVVTRSPAKLFVLDTRSGGAVEELDTCGDADDVFVDAKRSRYYVSCGSGAIDVFEFEEANYRHNRVTTVSGARTSLFVPDLDRLFVAVRASGSEPAAIWVYRPIR